MVIEGQFCLRSLASKRWCLGEPRLPNLVALGLSSSRIELTQSRFSNRT